MMNRKEIPDTSPYIPKVARVIAFRPEPERMFNDKPFNSCLVFHEDSTFSNSGMTVQESFEKYAIHVALEAKVKNNKESYRETDYGYTLCNNQVFMQIEMQATKPMLGYIDVFEIESMSILPPLGTLFIMKNGIFVPSTCRFDTALLKVNASQNFYDPKGEKHSTPIGMKMFMNISNNLIQSNPGIVMTRESMLLDMNDAAQLLCASQLCDYMEFGQPSQVMTRIRGLKRRTAPGLKRLLEIDMQLKAGSRAAGIPLVKTAREIELEKRLEESEKARKELEAWRDSLVSKVNDASKPTPQS